MPRRASDPSSARPSAGRAAGADPPGGRRGHPRADRGAPAAGVVRVIGGRLRGSRLPVPSLSGLRPTADRVRETLFNWLQGDLPGAQLLDAFAGSGALGIEAVSRGAAQVSLVERDAAAAEALRQSVARLGIAAQATVRCADVLALPTDPDFGPFDGLFLDPPFAGELWGPALAALAPRLRPGGWAYLESPRALVPPVPDDWRLHREGHTREVRYALYRKAAVPA